VNPTSSTSAPRRLRADAARNQQRIIEAARELFADRGLEITLDDVAECAGVGVGTVYRRFANKRELISEVFEHYVGEFADAADTAGQHPDAWLGLTQFFEYACHSMAANRGLGEVILEFGDDIERFHCVRDRITATMAAIVQRARAAGVVQPDLEPSDLFALIHMVDSIAEFAKPVNTQTWRRYMALVLNGIRSDVAPRQHLPVPALTVEEIDGAKTALCTRRH